MWLQERVINGEKGTEKWDRISQWINTPPVLRVVPTTAHTAAGPVPVLAPQQHAASFAAFAAFGG